MIQTLYNSIISEFIKRVKHLKIDAIVGIESRGFLYGFLLANKLGVPFVPIRKSGKLPCKKLKYKYDLEYGSSEIDIKEKAELDRKACYDILEKHVDSFLSGKTCGIADFYFYVLMNWDDNKTDELDKRPNLKKIFNQVNKTPSVQKVLKNQTS